MTPLDKARRALAEHESTRPDHLKAMHPSAPIALLKAWERWRDDHLALRTALEIEETAARAGWRDAAGNRVEVEPWKASPSAKTYENRANAAAIAKAAENRANHERRQSGTTKANGRPRSEEPTKGALRHRAARARKAELAA